MSLTALMRGPLSVTAPLVLNPLMAKMVMYLAGRGGLAGTGMTLHDLGGLGYRIVADPSTPLLAAYAAWKKVYQDLARGFGADIAVKPDWSPVERDMLAVIELEKLLAVERATVETGTA